jgi:methylated-DNA-protein-cysteine methyltransferase related protein
VVSSGGRSEPNGAFAERVARVVARTTPGEVVTYGEVAAEAGYPGAARAVGRVLRTTDVALPWWRVVSASGRLVPGIETEHADRLEAEGIEVDRVRGRLVQP